MTAIVLDIKFTFTGGEWNLQLNLANCQDIMKRFPDNFSFPVQLFEMVEITRHSAILTY